MAYYQNCPQFIFAIYFLCMHTILSNSILLATPEDFCEDNIIQVVQDTERACLQEDYPPSMVKPHQFLLPPNMLQALPRIPMSILGDNHPLADSIHRVASDQCRD
jgi:hypothetical protein